MPFKEAVRGVTTQQLDFLLRHGACTGRLPAYSFEEAQAEIDDILYANSFRGLPLDPTDEMEEEYEPRVLGVFDEF